MVSNQSLELRKSVTAKGQTLTSKGLIGSLSPVMDIGFLLHIKYGIDLQYAHCISSLSSPSYQSMHLLHVRPAR
jgi:hypothetical protein